MSRLSPEVQEDEFATARMILMGAPSGAWRTWRRALTSRLTPVRRDPRNSKRLLSRAEWRERR